MTETVQNRNIPHLSEHDQMLINSKWVGWNWLPKFVGITGVLASTGLAVFLYRNTLVDLHLIDDLSTVFPWIVFIVGSDFAILIAMLIRTAQVTRNQAIHLKAMNEALKLEMESTEAMRASQQKLEHALLQGQKLQAMGTLAGGIAHDFNNLLYAIIGYVEMARDDTVKGSQTYQNLGKVLEACLRGRDLVSRILTFSRRQQYQLDVLDLRRTIDGVVDLMQQTIPASVSLQFSMPDNMAVYGNKTLLHQVLVNIINNAVDAMDGEGTIELKVTRITANDPILHQFPDVQSSNYCLIEIIDTGHGMDHDTIERIFEPFYTTKEVGKGTGLGLSIVHSIVKEHKGEITVTSELGKGTTFIILLPEYQQTVRR